MSKKIPAGLVVLFGYILLSFLLKLEDNYGVAVVGTLPQGLPSLTIPKVPFTAYLSMILPAIGVLLVAFSEAVGVAHEFAEKHGYEVNADQELNAHALVNLGSALFGGSQFGECLLGDVHILHSFQPLDHGFPFVSTDYGEAFALHGHVLKRFKRF